MVYLMDKFEVIHVLCYTTTYPRVLLQEKTNAVVALGTDIFRHDVVIWMLSELQRRQSRTLHCGTGPDATDAGIWWKPCLWYSRYSKASIDVSVWQSKTRPWHPNRPK